MRGIYSKDGEEWSFDKVVETTDGPVRLRGTFHGTRDDAELDLAKRVLAVKEAARARHTFEQAVQRYEQEQYKLKSLPRVMQSARKLLPYFGGMFLEDIHQATVDPWIKQQMDKGDKTLTIYRDIRGVLVPILNRAHRMWRDGDKPWLMVVPMIKLPPPTDARKPRPLTWEEQDRLFSLLPAHLKPVAEFLVWTGLRMREALGLRWEWEIEVQELGTSVFLIPGSKIKNTEDRLVVLGKEALKVIERQWGKSKQWVFPGVKGGRMPRLDTPAWREAVKAIGGGIRVHDLKHTFGHRLRAAGVPLEARKTLLGHTTGDITSHYSAPDVAELLHHINAVSREQKTVFRLSSPRGGTRNFREERALRENVGVSSPT